MNSGELLIDVFPYQTGKLLEGHMVFHPKMVGLSFSLRWGSQRHAGDDLGSVTEIPSARVPGRSGALRVRNHIYSWGMLGVPFFPSDAYLRLLNCIICCFFSIPTQVIPSI